MDVRIQYCGVHIIQLVLMAVVFGGKQCVVIRLQSSLIRQVANEIVWPFFSSFPLSCPMFLHNFPMPDVFIQFTCFFQKSVSFAPNVPYIVFGFVSHLSCAFSRMFCIFAVLISYLAFYLARFYYLDACYIIITLVTYFYKMPK